MIFSPFLKEDILRFTSCRNELLSENSEVITTSLFDILNNVDKNKTVKMSLYDMMGKEIFELHGEINSLVTEYKNKIMDCETGIYLIQLTQENDSKVFKSKVYINNLY